MLNPKNDRLDYGAILTPPVGYELDAAVGTTYSLDLDALVGACLSLGLSEDTDSELLHNPICLLEALRATGDKVALFCESGQIDKPGNPTALYVLLEKVVFSITTPKRRGIANYPSFHPKTWLLRFVNGEGHVRYRFIVLSRNLTFDRSWDVTYYMDGELVEEETDKNVPLADFLRYLSRQLPKDENGQAKRRMIRSVVKELAHVRFAPSEKEFYDFEFLPTGVPAEDGHYYDIRNSDLFRDTFHEVMIMSPFLTGSVIKDFNDRNSLTGLQRDKYMLLTREMSLGKLKPEDVSHFEMFILRDNVIEGETRISEDAPEAKMQDLHAKVYMTRKYSDTSLYVGSLNASHNAVSGNVEFMLRLKAQNRYLNLTSLTNSMFGLDEENPFQPLFFFFSVVEDVEDPTNRLNQIVKEITRSKLSASVQEQDGSYSICVESDYAGADGYEISIKPLLSQRSNPFSNYLVFSNLSLMQLSEFYAIKVSNEEAAIERVVLIPTANLPDGREKAVVNSVISDKTNFYRYIAFLLGDDLLLGMLDGIAGEKSSANGLNHAQPTMPALYEKMLKTAVQDPDKFKGIDYLIKMVSDDNVIPDDFLKLYQTFREAVKWNG